MEIWVSLTITAAFSQNFRSVLQKELTTKISTLEATRIRFLYAAPFALLFLVILHFFFRYPLPSPNRIFIIYAVIGSIAQILGSELLLKLFSYRNFFVSTTYSKTESIQTAVLGLAVLSDHFSIGAFVGILLGVIGVFIISNRIETFNIKKIGISICSRSTLIGISSGFLFAVAAVSFRGASLALTGDYIIKAAFTLCFVLIFQSLLAGTYLVTLKRTEHKRERSFFMASWLIGLTGMIASLCWISAMAMQNAAYVRALGQTELVFALLASIIIFKEKIVKSELIGFSFIVAGVGVLLLYK